MIPCLPHAVWHAGCNKHPEALARGPSESCWQLLTNVVTENVLWQCNLFHTLLADLRAGTAAAIRRQVVLGVPHPCRTSSQTRYQPGCITAMPMLACMLCRCVMFGQKYTAPLMLANAGKSAMKVLVVAKPELSNWITFTPEFGFIQVRLHDTGLGLRSVPCHVTGHSVLQRHKRSNIPGAA